MTKEEFSELLKQHGMTNREFARAIGKNEDIISQWKHGHFPISTEAEALIREYFKGKESKIVFLHEIPIRGRFHVPGEQRIFIKRHNRRVIKTEETRPDGTIEKKSTPACFCVDSKGVTFVKSWYDKVIAVPDEE